MTISLTPTKSEGMIIMYNNLLIRTDGGPSLIAIVIPVPIIVIVTGGNYCW